VECALIAKNASDPERVRCRLTRVTYVLTLILLHLVGFAAFVGAACAQQQLMRSSSGASLAAAVRDDREALAARICAKVEVPALFAQLGTGILLVVSEPGYLRQHWLHGKLSAVLLLLVLANLELINARKIVALRAARGAGTEGEIATRKRRHAVLGAVGAVAVVAVLLFVTVLRPLI
jgi:uncharacterized membrane protein